MKLWNNRLNCTFLNLRSNFPFFLNRQLIFIQNSIFGDSSGSHAFSLPLLLPLPLSLNFKPTAGRKRKKK